MKGLLIITCLAGCTPLMAGDPSGLGGGTTGEPDGAPSISRSAGGDAEDGSASGSEGGESGSDPIGSDGDATGSGETGDETTTTGSPPTAEGWPPYPADSFWNTPIPDDAAVHPDSASMLARIDGDLSSDVTQNSYPLYVVDDTTPTATVHVSNYFSYYENFGVNPDGDRVGAGFAPSIDGVPVPAGATNGSGSDAQILFWNPETGSEWAFWQFTNGGSYGATNGYRYDTSLGSGRTEGSGRGAGVTKLGGLVTAEEAEVFGHVAHAVAFAYQRPTPQFVYPATKSDGGGTIGQDIPEGARIQLDPSIDLDALGLSPTARAIAEALQTYGLIVVDGSGRPKAFLESDVTGSWADVGAMEYALAPLTAGGWATRFRVIDWNAWTGGPTGVLGP